MLNQLFLHLYCPIVLTPLDIGFFPRLCMGAPSRSYALQIFGFFYWSEGQLIRESGGYGSAQHNIRIFPVSF
jgi:hypothetical protein